MLCQAMGRPKEHDEQTRAQLLEAAGRLLAAEGPAALTVRRLAQEVGTTTRAVYTLFGNKEGLVSVMYQCMADTLVQLHEAVERRTDPVDEILPLTLAYRESALTHPDLYPLIFGNAVPGFRPRPEAIAHARRGFARVLDAFERGRRKRRFVGRSPHAMGHALWALVHGLASLELGGALGPPDEAQALWHDAVSAMVRAFMRAPEPLA
jgi:AcrR family transcriptional regulator